MDNDMEISSKTMKNRHTQPKKKKGGHFSQATATNADNGHFRLNIVEKAILVE